MSSSFPWNNVVFFSVEIYYPLVGTASEKQFRVPELQDERPVHNHIYIRQNHGQSRVGPDFFNCEARVAPDGLG